MAALLFTATIPANDERCVDLPGFSHWGESRPDFRYAEGVRTVFFFARNRSQAARHLDMYMGVTGPCNLSAGRQCSALLSASIERALA